MSEKSNDVNIYDKIRREVEEDSAARIEEKAKINDLFKRQPEPKKPTDELYRRFRGENNE